MATILTIKKNGEAIKKEVKEDVETILLILNGDADFNLEPHRFSRQAEYICLTLKNGKKIIYNRRYINMIYE